MLFSFPLGCGFCEEMMTPFTAQRNCLTHCVTETRKKKNVLPESSPPVMEMEDGGTAELTKITQHPLKIPFPELCSRYANLAHSLRGQQRTIATINQTKN